MKKYNCIFCRIAAGEAPAYKIYEDKNYVAFLDIRPNIAGQSVIVPKKHLSSIFSEAGNKNLANFIIAAKKVSNLLRKKLDVQRVNLVLEGTGIDHLHAKLYPTAGVRGRGTVTYEKEPIYFPKYVGYLTTLLGPKAKDSVLKKLQEKIAKQRR